MALKLHAHFALNTFLPSNLLKDLKGGFLEEINNRWYVMNACQTIMCLLLYKIPHSKHLL